MDNVVPDRTIQTALHRRLEHLCFIDTGDFETLDTLLAARVQMDSGQWVVMEGQPIDQTFVLVTGWAIRSKSFADGRRQILEILLPGDIVGLYSVMLRRADYAVEILKPATLAVFPSSKLIDVSVKAPRLTLALSWLAGQGERRSDEQVSRIGRRGAVERMAHLFVELYVRLRRIGMNHDMSARFPLTQTILADTLGMSHVHANRSFRALVRDQPVSFRDGGIVVLDLERLATRCNFDPDYLEQPEAPDDVQVSLNDTAAHP